MQWKLVGYQTVRKATNPKYLSFPLWLAVMVDSKHTSNMVNTRETHKFAKEGWRNSCNN